MIDFLQRILGTSSVLSSTPKVPEVLDNYCANVIYYIMEAFPEFGDFNVAYYHEGDWIREEWSMDDVYHRIGGPAITYYDPDTRAVTKRIYKHSGETHRWDGPAIEEIDPETGVVTLEEYYQYDKLCRLDEPARIRRDRVSGEVISEEQFWQGHPYQGTILEP